MASKTNQRWGPEPVSDRRGIGPTPPARPEDDRGVLALALDLPARHSSIGHCGWASWYGPHTRTVYYGIVVSAEPSADGEWISLVLEDFDQEQRLTARIPAKWPVRVWR